MNALRTVGLALAVCVAAILGIALITLAARRWWR